MPPLKPFLAPIGLVLLAIAAGLLSITHQSFWMDEASSAFRAVMPTLKEWWQINLHLGGSDVQMPVYLFLVWVWHQLGATSEYAMRLVNLPWVVLAVLALKREKFWPLLILLSPFAVYYAGELRPYSMQIAGGACAAAALWRMIDGREQASFSGLHAACGAALVLCASSLTGVVWAAGLAAGLIIIRTDWLAMRGFWLRVAAWAPAFVALAGFYGFTLLKGYRAAAMDGGGLLSMGFGIYELLGLTGLGPGRNEIRSNPSVLLNWLPTLAVGTLCIATAWFCGVSQWLRRATRRDLVGVALCVLLPMLVLAAAGMLMGFRVLGRHLSPALPAVLLPIAALLSAPGFMRKLPALLAAAVFLVSSVIVRLEERHARDDYRRATGIAITSLQQGKQILWKADMNAPRYYAFVEGGRQLTHLVQGMESNPPSGLMFADLIVVNRPDLRFGGKDYRKELRTNRFELKEEFTGFEVWEAR